MIGLEIGDQVQLGEVVRIDSDGVTAKPFDSHVGAGLGIVALPHAAEDDCRLMSRWKGRVLNALA